MSVEILKYKDQEIHCLLSEIKLLSHLIENKDEEIKNLKEELEKLNGELNRYKSMVWLCEKVKDCDKE